jgi:flagellum-specific peptidoglycan hydrolase FlgJ
MREPTKRVNLSKGSQYDHAYYKNWLDSVYDYGFYYATYLSRITTEEDYFAFLSEYYAEDCDYVRKLKEIIVNENLKSLFN